MRTNLIIGGLFVLVAISIATFFLAPAGRALLDHYSLLPRTEGATALYFSGSDTPTSFTANQPFQQNFIIENREHSAVDYTYDIAQDDRPLASGNVTIDSGKQQEITPEVILSQADAGKTKFTITIRFITGSSEKNSSPQTRSIFIWLTNKEESTNDDPKSSGETS